MVLFFAALVTIADGSLPHAETHRIEEPCGVVLIGASLPRKVVAWERTQGAVVEATQGFTLVEIAIVLTVIGLIVGGILWGAEMIGQAATRAQISQVEKFNTAANTFITKYGYLPGDIPDPYASQFGFQPRGQYAGEGDGNGIIEGVWQNAANSNYGSAQGLGETGLFWVDLSTANMLDSSITAATATTLVTLTSSTSFSSYFPKAKIGNNYIYVWSGGSSGYGAVGNGINYFGISIPVSVSVSCNSCLYSTPGLTVQQAYNIDKKIDDGLPQSGKVTAQYVGLTSGGYWGTWAGNSSATNGPTTAATASSSTTCYDNGNATGVTQQYSMKQNSGSGLNCALSFQMQGAAR